MRQEYALENYGAVPAVHANDVFFAIHAAVLTAITLVQCCIHDRGGQVRHAWHLHIALRPATPVLPWFSLSGIASPFLP